MNKPHQHTIPQFYLKRFLNPGWVYRRGELIPRAEANPRRVSVRKGYYGPDKRGKQALDSVNSKLESKGAPSFARLIDEPEKITGEDWVILSYLFANLWARTPCAIEEMRATHLSFYKQATIKMEQMKVKFNEALAKGEDLTPFTANGLLDSSPRFSLDDINRAAERLSASDGHISQLRGMFKILPSISKCIQKMSYLIVEPPKGYFFLTSDRPLTIQSRLTGSRVGAGWGNTDVLASIPLSPSQFLVMSYYDGPRIHLNSISPEDVALFNLETIKYASEEVYSPIKYQEADDWMRGVGRWIRKT